ncbi:hypothetical protein [Kandleria vitulina]|uniref:hypothetical protein n=1 Tax=Kandleria vitulina TaxID=1630 RepID=UPI000490314F|nr:hypothetical protein [Kandleria vitulina]
MADIKTHLRELSVATTIGLLNQEIDFQRDDLYVSNRFFAYAQKLISTDISNAKNICNEPTFTGELKTIVDNGYQLGEAIYNNKRFKFKKDDIITWQGNNTQKEDPIDITVGSYGFSLKEESFILENMGLYKLLNCYTGSNYKKRHIFSDYARKEYEIWFDATWKELLKTLSQNNGKWSYDNAAKRKKGIIIRNGSIITLSFFKDNNQIAESKLPVNCKLADFEKNTSSKTREEVFSKYIHLNLDNNNAYNEAKTQCAVASTKALAKELTNNLNYKAGLPRFLRIHNDEYYYAKTTSAGVEIFRVPSIDSFGQEIVIESIESSVPNKQANILTTIKNKNTDKELVLRNECRFSHGQFNGTPEAKMYYERGGSLEAIYEKI